MWGPIFFKGTSKEVLIGVPNTSEQEDVIWLHEAHMYAEKLHYGPGM